MTAVKSFFETVSFWYFVDCGPEYTAFSNQGLDGGFYEPELYASQDNGSALKHMDLLYSTSLLMALAAGIGTIIIVGIGLLILQKEALAFPNRSLRGLKRASWVLFEIGACAGVLSVVVHWKWGHGIPGSNQLSVSEFATTHPAFIVEALLICAGAVLLVQLRNRIARKIRGTPGKSPENSPDVTDEFG